MLLRSYESALAHHDFVKYFWPVFAQRKVSAHKDGDRLRLRVGLNRRCVIEHAFTDATKSLTAYEPNVVQMTQRLG